MESGGDIKLFGWWQLNANINVFNYKLTTSVSNIDKVQQVLTWDARLVNSFKLKSDTRIQVSGHYHAPGVDAMGNSSGYVVLDMSVNQPLLKGKANLSLSGQNLVPIIYTYSVKTEDFNNTYRISYEGPTLMLNLTYNFNNFNNRQRGRSDDLQFKGGGGF